MNKFRELRADEIDCRISQIHKQGEGLALLLYKDARCDQNILDETVGPMNWQRHHSRDNRNCVVSIWDEKKKAWIEKEDTGTESETEKEKGLASDSFKRACFNWGIGRELYTAPFIWIKKEDCRIKDIGGKLKCFDRFTVKAISYTNSVITGLKIKNQATGRICFSWGNTEDKEGSEAPEKPEQPETEPGVVEKTDKLPNEAQNKTPGGAQNEIPAAVNYIRNHITEIQEKENLKTYKAAREKVFGMADTLIKGGVVPKFSWSNITLDEAKNLFAAIKMNFYPEEDPENDLEGDLE